MVALGNLALACAETAIDLEEAAASGVDPVFSGAVVPGSASSPHSEDHDGDLASSPLSAVARDMALGWYG